MALGLSLAVISLLGFALSQLYILKTLDEYARQVGEWIKETASSHIAVGIRETEKSPEVMMYPIDVVFEVGSVDGFREVIEEWHADEHLSGERVHNVTLYLHDYYYWVFLRDENSTVTGVTKLNVKSNSPYHLLSEVVSTIGAVLGVILALCIVWRAKNNSLASLHPSPR